MTLRNGPLIECEYPGSSHKIEMIFRVLHFAWEADSLGYVVSVTDALGQPHKRLILTNHGSPYFATVEDLDERMELYREVMSDTQKAKDFLAKENT